MVRVAGTPGQSISTDCTIAADSTVVLCALGAGWPLVDLGGGVSVRFLGDGELLLEGLVVVGGPLRVLDDGTVRRRRLHLRHCTLVPGLRLAPDGAPRHPGEPSLIVDAPGVEVVIEHSIVGGLRLHRDVELRASDSVIDATDAAQPALCAPDGAGPIGPLTLDGCTVIGAVHAALARLISNAILLAETPTGWPAPVVMERRQAGCVRFSWLPVESIVPRRFRCLPSEVAPGEPRHLSLRYGHPGYAMLHPATALAIRRAADDEDEPGAMHQARRQRRLRHAAIRVEEHLRAGFAAGLIEVVPRGTVGLAGDRFSDPTT